MPTKNPTATGAKPALIEEEPGVSSQSNGGSGLTLADLTVAQLGQAIALGLAGAQQAVAEREAAEMEAAKAAHTAKRDRMKAVLDAEPRRTIRLPVSGRGVVKGPYPVQINGYRVNVPRGVDVEVPQSIFDLLQPSEEFPKAGIWGESNTDD